MRKCKFEIKCEKCGKPQQKNEKMSNGNWNVYDSNEICECGGKFVLYCNGKKVC